MKKLPRINRESIEPISRKGIESKYYLLSEAARFLDISEKTLRRWEDAGKIKSIKTVGGHRRFSIDELQSIKFNQKIKETVKNLESKYKHIQIPQTPVIRIEKEGNNSYGQNHQEPDLFELAKAQKLVATRFIKVFLLLLALIISTKIIAPKIYPYVSKYIFKDKQVAFLDNVLGVRDETNNEVRPRVLQAAAEDETLRFDINIESNFAEDVTFEQNVEVQQDLTVTGTADVATLAITGVEVTSTATEINYLDGLTLTAGGITYSTTTGLNVSAAGSADQILVSAGSGTPVWKNITDLDSNVDATTIDGLDSTAFLRSNTNDTFETGNTLTIAGTLDANGDLLIADTDITFDGASTTFTTTGDLTFASGGGDLLTTSRMTLGSTTAGSSQLMIDGSSDIIQLQVQGHSTQTSSLFLLEQSDGTDIISVGGTGAMTFTNSSSSNIAFQLAGTGDLTINANGTPYTTFSDNQTISFTDGTLLDLSSISHNDVAAQGIKLPQATSFTAISGGTEGYLAWDTDGNNLAVFDGSSWTAIGSGSLFTDGGAITYLTSTTDDLALGGTTSESALFADVSASALHFNPYGTSSGNTGEVRFEELEANGDHYTGFKSADSLAGNVIYTLPSADATISNQVLASSGAGVLSWIDVSAGAGTLWTDGGAITYLTSGTDDLAVGGTDTDSPLFFDESASALSLNPYGTSSGNTGEIRFEELEANGDHYTGFKSPNSLAGNVVYTLPAADATSANQILSSNSAGVLSWIDVSAGAGGVWTDGGTNTYLTTTTDDVVIGGSTQLSSAKVSIDGDDDQIQLIVQGNATQTSATHLFVVETSAGSDLFSIDVNGDLVLSGELDINGSGTHDIAGTLNLSGNTLAASGDLLIDPAGQDVTIDGDLILSDTFTLQVGGKTATGYNAFANSADAPEEAGISADNDLYIGGDLEIDGTIYGALSGSFNPGLTTGSVLFQGASGITEDNANFFWDDGNNRLGIGTTSPQNQISSYESTGAANNRISLRNLDTGNSTSDGVFMGLTSAEIFQLWNFENTDMQIGTNNSEVIRVKSTGLVGIGTTSPTSKLHVNGAVTGKALGIFNETGNQDILVASSSGSTKFVVKNTGDVNIGTSTVNDVDVTLYGDIFQQANNDLTAITGINDTYVYDTTKDSDGGKWTNNEQAQVSSWYTETKDDGAADACSVSTDDRCGRSAFPKKATIVADDTNVYIFDALDNSLWMKFTQSGGTFALGADTDNNPSSVFALDGVVYVGTNGASGTGLYAFDFKKDQGFRYNATNRTSTGISGIDERNTAVTYGAGDSVFAINSALVNDVHAAVINGETFIAIATDTDMSVIRPNSNVVYDYSDSSGDDYNTVWITKDGKLYGLNEALGQAEKWKDVHLDNTSEVAGTPDKLWDESSIPALATAAPTIQISPSTLFVDEKINGGDNIYVGTDQGLTAIYDIHGDESNGSVKYYNTSRITEEIVGDVEGMWGLNETASLTSVGTDIADSSDASNKLMIQAGTTASQVSANGIRNYGITFDGTDDYLCSDTNDDTTCDDDGDLDFDDAEQFSIRFCFNSDSTVSYVEYLVAKKSAVTNGVGYAVYLDASGDVVFGVDDDTTSFPEDSAATSGIDYDDQQWHHVVALRQAERDDSTTAYRSGHMRLYVDGILVASDTSISSSTTLANAGSFSVGSDQGGATYFGGTIDEVMVIRDLLNGDQIKRMYQAGRQAEKKKTIDVTNATSATSTTIVDSGETWVAKEFAGSFVEINGGTGANQTRRITKNTTAGSLTVSSAWTTTPDTTSDFQVHPEELYGATNTVKAVTLSDAAPGEVKHLYVGTNDGSDGGGVTRFKSDGDYVTDLYHGDAGRSDDGSAAWNTTANYDDIEAISSKSELLSIGAQDQFWTEYTAKSLTEKIDELTNQVNQLQLAVANTPTLNSYKDGTVDRSAAYQVIRRGWSTDTGTNVNAGSQVNFGITFDTIPSVITNPIGYLTGAVVPTALTQCGRQFTVAIGTPIVTVSSYTTGAATSAVGSDYYCWTWMAIGTYTGGSAQSGIAGYAGGADLAEWYATDDMSLQAGEVVSVDKEGDIEVSRSDRAYDTSSIGIIATKPSLTIGPESGLTPGYKESEEATESGKSVAVALAGRVPVKVSLENGPIKAGDYLTTSSTPGYAMKATKAGPTIGKAMENFDGKSTIAAFGTEDAVVTNIELPEGTGEEVVAKDPTLAELDKGFGTVMAFVNTSWYGGELTADGNIEVSLPSDIKISSSTNLFTRIFNTISRNKEEASESTQTDELKEATDSANISEFSEISITSAMEKLVERIETLEGEITLLKSSQVLSETDSISEDVDVEDGIQISSDVNALTDTVINGKLNVGITQIDNTDGSINSIGKLKLQSLALDSIEFMGGLVEIDKNGNLNIKEGQVIGNDSFRGNETIKAGQKSIEVKREWNSIPKSITVTPDYNTSVWITGKTEDGFIINVDRAPLEDAVIDWIAIW